MMEYVGIYASTSRDVADRRPSLGLAQERQVATRRVKFDSLTKKEG